MFQGVNQAPEVERQALSLQEVRDENPFAHRFLPVPRGRAALLRGRLDGDRIDGDPVHGDGGQRSVTGLGYWS